MAARNGNSQLVQIFLDRDVPVNARDSLLRTPVHYACQSGDLQTLRLLVEAGGSIFDKDHNGWSAVHFAVNSGSFELFRNLSDYEPAVIHQIDYQGSTPLHRAVKTKFDNGPILKYLMKKGAKSNLRDNDHRTAFNLATMHNTVWALEALNGVKSRPRPTTATQQRFF